ncbi:Sulfate transport system permease protein CysW [Hafnia alvei]|uniref:Sulfate transport system permease protein CysW n=1 Tax=Hafnia alvei TaxID=569 RepID=A0A377PGH7_HAFAL|nr:Sulfate transport system permease protein CysW [Hafnia alvei]
MLLSRAAPKRVLPGFTLSLGSSLLYTCLILLLPLSALVMQLAQMTWQQYWDVITNPQVVAAYKVTLLAAGVASVFNAIFGMLMAWILTRYEFPGKTLLDGLMDLPFALPTAVAGLTLAGAVFDHGLVWAMAGDDRYQSRFHVAWYCRRDGVYQHSVCGAYRTARAGRTRP